VLLLLAATFLLFRPDWLVNQFSAKYISLSASQVFKVADELRKGDWLVVAIAGDNVEGATIKKTVAIPLGEGANGRERLRNGGVTLQSLGESLEITNVKFGSQARKLGVEQGFKIIEVKERNPARPSDYWAFMPALGIAGFVWWLQGRRLRIRTGGTGPV
jgi:Domain of unknown function (DUF3394)